MDIFAPKTGKNYKIFGIRGSLIGDNIMALPLLTLIEKLRPDCYKYWQVARKGAQMVPLLLNHPLIDRIVISDCEEGMGPKDIEIAKKCDIVFDVMPQHPAEQDWPNYRNIYEETALMAGFSMQNYNLLTEEEKRPKLVKWFNVEKQPAKTIALWPCAGYGNENKRNPSEEWYFKLLEYLTKEGYVVLQFGHPKDYNLHSAVVNRGYYSQHNFFCKNTLPFFDQIKMTLGCDLVISTDSGSGLIFGAYEMPQITLLTNHFPNHTKNLTAFAPNNLKNTNFIGVGSPDNILHEEVLKKVKEICP